jgi:hypothetical protein
VVRVSASASLSVAVVAVVVTETVVTVKEVIADAKLEARARRVLHLENLLLSCKWISPT